MMEDNFRTVLIILSSVVILAIFIHGLWTIRKNKNPYKLKTTEQTVDEIERNFDQSGFDQDGVSKPKVVKRANNEVKNENSISEPVAASQTPKVQDNTEVDHNTQFDDAQLRSDTTSSEPKISQALMEKQTDADVLEFSVTLAEDEIRQQEDEVKHKLNEVKQAVYDDPIIQAKPKVSKKSAKQQHAEKLKRNQMEMNFEQPQVVEQDPEFLILSVAAHDNDVIHGAALLPCLLTLGLRFGDMDIFHRHQDNAGNGEITFSLANMLNPGTFDLDNMESFTTRGVSLFMKLPNAGNPFEVFEQMLAAAKQLAKEFNGQILDEQRSVMTKQTEQHYISKIREFERKSRISAR